ncbi:MAG: DegT/DnrJ/EryC1/StrS family aminotransferase [Candidatus Kapaibacterium sp.]|jgi:dTDP-4-amino-4,6-dideoxygalactose transaminase
MTVPLLDLKLQYATIQHECEQTLSRLAASQALILGQETTKLEKDLAEYCGCSYALGVSSGTDALLMALMALDLQPGDEIIVPTYSFFATAGVVSRLHAIPVFVDSDPVTCTMDPEAAEKAITSRTRAIMPVHLYGQSANMTEFLRISNEHGIPLIEDAAQALGTQYKNDAKVGSMGLMGCYSFYPTKNLGAFGDAGLITTNDDALYVKLKQMRNHGMEPRYYHKFVGGNFRIDEIQSGILNVKFPHLESWHAARRRNAALYLEAFLEKELATGEGVLGYDAHNKVRLPKAVYKSNDVVNYHIYNQYVIHVERRDELRAFLTTKGVGSEIYYPVPFHRQECFGYLQPKNEDFPVANSLAAQTIALPIFPELRPEQIRYVVDCIAEFMSTQA